jgi:hypothetical protein
MSDKSDNRPHNNSGDLAALTAAGILGFTAGMVWYHLLSEDSRRKKLFKKMKHYRRSLLKDMT